MVKERRIVNLVFGSLPSYDYFPVVPLSLLWCKIPYKSMPLLRFGYYVQTITNTSEAITNNHVWPY